LDYAIAVHLLAEDSLMIKEVSKIFVSSSVIGRLLSINFTNSSVAVCLISNAHCRTTVKASEN
jgi:hypothetical protein